MTTGQRRASGIGTCALCVLLFCLPPVGAAAAQDKASTTTEDRAARAQARILFSAAEDSFARDDFGTALRLFQEAQSTSFNAAVNFNIAVCLERLGSSQDALAAYTEVQASPALDASIKARAAAAIERLSPMAIPKPLPLPSPPEVNEAALPISPVAQPFPVLRPVGWVGAGAAALGLGAASTVWLLGRANQREYYRATDFEKAQSLYDKADSYDTGLKASWALALTGLATVALDRLLRD